VGSVSVGVKASNKPMIVLTKSGMIANGTG